MARRRKRVARRVTSKRVTRKRVTRKKGFVGLVTGVDNHLKVLTLVFTIQWTPYRAC